MRRFLLILALPLLATVALAVGANLQIWPQLPGIPNYSIGLPEAMYGQHPLSRESYGEGWFWLGAYSDGSYSFTNFMISNLGPGDNKGTMDVTVWEPSGKTYLQRAAFTSGPMKAATGKMDVQVNNNRIWGTFPNFNVKVAEKDVALDMKYQAILPSFTINSGRVVYDKVDDFYSVYVTSPRAKISGSLRTPGGSRQVTGFGYTDHGVVTMLPHEYSNRWFTLRCFDEKYTLDILEFTVPQKWGGQRVPMIVFGENNQIVYGGTQYKLTPNDWRTEPKFGKKYPGSYTFAIDRPGKVKVEGTYSVKTIMHAIDILSQLNFVERQIAGLFAKSYVLRFLVEVKATVTYPDGRQENFDAPGVAEVLYIQ